MTRGAGARRRLAAGVLAAALGVTGLSPGSPSAAAAVAHRDPSVDAVLIVHAAAAHHALGASIAAAEHTGAVLRHTFARPRSFSVQVPASGVTAEITRLRRLPGVTSVERPVTRQLFAAPDEPDDPDFARQKSYLDAVDAPRAWAVQHGSRAVTVAVLDTGVDVTQPDLVGKIVGTYDADGGGSDVTDEIGHGTFVAGVAAAATDNLIGVAGAGYDTSILGVKIATDDGQLPVDDEIAGIRWAVAHGTNIINLSLGGPDYSASERSAIDYAISRGVLVVAAAGNTGRTAKQYPAAYPGVVAVGATDPAHHTRADFTTRGNWVTLAAPGVGIYSTTPRGRSQDYPGTTGYAAGDGTSFAAPMVAGEAALLEAQDPALGEQGVRAALIASAHGYQDLGLGAGQVDFSAALAQVAPRSTPSTVLATGTAGEVPVSATSSAPRVAFRLDSGPLGTPVAVSDGTASTTIPSYGYPNGTHDVHAYDCSAADVCSTSSTDGTVVFANTAPAITAPADGADETGRFVVTATHDGGGARLLVDGTPTAFAAASPFTFAVDGSALDDGTHTLGVQLCGPDGGHCSGPESATRTVDTRSLHPAITPPAPATISPNHDGVDDTTTLTFTLPDTETVSVQTVDSAGTVVRTVPLHTLAAGRHQWTWHGMGADAPLPDGRYVLALETSATDAGAELRGYAATPATIDTTAPTLTRATGGGSTFYPVRDGYRDTFVPHVDLGAAGHLALVIATSGGRVVRTVRGYRHEGEAALVWNGRDHRGDRVGAGRYRWWFTATDEAGNTRLGAVHRVTVSSERLVHRTLGLRLDGASARSAVGTRPSCSSASRRSSGYPHGILLVNGCRPSTGDLAFATYRFTIPDALSYGRMVVAVYGRSSHRPSELTAAVQRTDGGLEVRHYAEVTRSGARWVRIASTPVAEHLTRAGRVRLGIVLDSAFAGRNDFDLKYVRLRVGVTRLH